MTESGRSGHAESVGGGGVLIVDDRPENLLALEASLEPLDVPITRAESGAEALRSLLTHDFAVILLDVQMPELDGFETARIIKSRPRTSHIPIIFLTAISREREHQLRGYGEGAVDYLAKPFEPEVLRSKVAVFVELQRQARQIEAQNTLLEERLEQRDRAQAALAHHARELQRSNDELDHLATIACHDLLEPLQVLGGLLELLELRHAAELAPEGRDLLDRAHRRAVELAGEIDRLLVGARANAEPARREPVDLNAVLDRARQELAARLERSGVTVTADPLPTVVGDEWQLGVLLGRVLSDALDEAEAAVLEANPTVHVGLSRRRGDWVITVGDGGVEPWDPPPNGRAAAGVGEGIGEGIGEGRAWLGVCQRILDGHGGSLWMETVPARRPSVSFSLPVV